MIQVISFAPRHQKTKTIDIFDYIFFVLFRVVRTMIWDRVRCFKTITTKWWLIRLKINFYSFIYWLINNLKKKFLRPSVISLEYHYYYYTIAIS